VTSVLLCFVIFAIKKEMEIAIFGKSFGDVFFDNCHQLFNYLHQKSIKIYIYRPFYDFLLEKVKLRPNVAGFFSEPGELPAVDMLFSIGGDGTFLKAVTFVRDSGIPVVGINRLTFLAMSFRLPFRKSKVVNIKLKSLRCLNSFLPGI
jgi:NAD kinase